MWRFKFSFVTVIVNMALVSILQAASIDNEANAADRIQELHDNQVTYKPLTVLYYSLGY